MGKDRKGIGSAGGMSGLSGMSGMSGINETQRKTACNQSTTC